MPDAGGDIHPVEEIGGALRSLVRPPFVALLLLDLLIAIAGASISELLGTRAARQEYSFLVFTSSIFFAATTVYLQIAATLAAGSGGETHGADAWIKAALRHRCFWRYLGASFLVALLILVGAIMLVVGAVIMGRALLLAQPSVVLERANPVDAISRSVELSKPARKALAVIFVVVWLPPLATGLVFEVVAIDLDFAWQALIALAGAALGMAATIAVTRVFVKLGGAPTPPLPTLLYKSKAGSRT